MDDQTLVSAFNNGDFNGIILIIILVSGFIILREFWCWYWKINERVALLKKIEENTRRATPPGL